MIRSLADVGSGCLGADTLLQLLKNYARSRGIKTSITVGVVGLPNVGKSSLINSLKRSRVAQVGNTPGVTRGVQEVVLDKTIRLLDSPGVIFSADDDAAAALRNSVKVERLADPLAPVAVILQRVPKKQLMAVYKIASFADVDEFLRLIAAARGKLKRGGIPDMTAAARIVLQDWNGGVIPFYTLPPSRGNEEHESAAVVAGWAAEFDAEKVFAAEATAVISQLPSMEGAGAAFFEAASAGRARVELPSAASGGRGTFGGGGGGGGDSMEGSSSDEEEEGEEEEGDGMDVGDGGGGAAARRGKAPAPAAAAAAKAALYGEEGQFDPRKVRAEKKARKKSKVAAAAPEVPAEGGDGSDFDFDEANEADGGSGGGSASGSGSDEEYGAGGGGEDADRAYADAMEGSDLEEEGGGGDD
ncbi:Guanine nucleotide-binding protein-like 3 [Monoraphidium neglectum]|uniref:Guanine nucleotide-binding protein-like 3 n=1 Tax=Monoraphidium neglectum TaxID=145388 RepID=A0A0D2IYS0_9CHLO|nr:Guanine nucleotide-binding protein-like 3 [Monoraphidium neglectum]KIY93032.1 Guanine nucleotide-binding protein-like 3 [Monoraphidium neglectum]|eukprot:XP_013892052.1 Guanine nucleotide-binding protein-like 3 [Monoraphidium neglectum]